MPVFLVSIPGVFIALAGVMLLLGMAALWQSLRSAFGGGPTEDLGAGSDLNERSALLAEKKTLLRAIKDIQFEREVGKISDEDFARLDKAYRRRAKEVLKLLDQDLGEFLTKAERLVADAMSEEDGDAYRSGKVKRRKRKGRTKGKRRRKQPKQTFECPACGAGNDFDATFCQECATRLAPVDCPACGTPNDPDAKFCKSCAKPLQEEEAEARAGAGAGSAVGSSASEGAAAAAASDDAAEASSSAADDGDEDEDSEDADSESEDSESDDSDSEDSHSDEEDDGVSDDAKAEDEEE